MCHFEIRSDLGHDVIFRPAAIHVCRHGDVDKLGVRQAEVLPHVRTDHWLTDPIAAIVSFYGMVETVARARGINPDTPRHLNKVTETI